MIARIEIKTKVVIFHSSHWHWNLSQNIYKFTKCSFTQLGRHMMQQMLSERFFTSWDRQVSVLLCSDLTSVAELKLRLDNRLTAVSTQLFISYDFLFICFAWCSFIKIALIVQKEEIWKQWEAEFWPKDKYGSWPFYWVSWQMLPLLVSDVHDTHSNHKLCVRL